MSMLSTIHDDTMISKERRSRQASGGVETIQKALIIGEAISTWEGWTKAINWLYIMILGRAQRNDGNEHSSISWN